MGKKISIAEQRKGGNMLQVDDKGLRRTAWNVFRGWMMESFPAGGLERFADEAKKVKDQYNGIALEDAQCQSMKVIKQKISLPLFICEFTQTRLIASKGEICADDIYELCLASIADFMLEQIYGVSKNFEYEGHTDEELKELAFKFVLGLTISSLKPNFLSGILAQASIDIPFARGRGMGKSEILELLFRSNSNNMSFTDFCRNMPVIIRIFRFGGINNEQEVYQYFKIFLAHKIYQLNMKF